MKSEIRSTKFERRQLCLLSNFGFGISNLPRKWWRHSREQRLQLWHALRGGPACHAGLPDERRTRELPALDVRIKRGHVERAGLLAVERRVERDSRRERRRAACARGWSRVCWSDNTRRARSACKRPTHLLTDRDTGAETCPHARKPAGVRRGRRDRFGGLELRVLVEITEHRHLRTLVECCFHFRWERNALDEELRQRHAHFRQLGRDPL